MKLISQIGKNQTDSKTSTRSKQLLRRERRGQSHFIWLLRQVFRRKFATAYIIIGSIISIGLNMARPNIQAHLFGILYDMYDGYAELGVKPSFIVFFGSVEVNMIILRYVLIIFALGAASLLINISVGVLNEYVAQSTERDIRNKFYASVQSKSMTFHDTTKVGEIMSQATFDVRIINATVSPGLRMITNAVMTASVAISLTFYYEWRIGLVIVGMVPLYIWATTSYTRRIKPLTEKVQKQFGICNSLLQENVSGIRVVRAFTAEKHEIKRFMKEVDTLRDDIIRRGERRALYFPPLILSIGIAISIGLSVLFIYNGTMSADEAMAINGMLVLLYDPTYMISWVLFLTHMGLAGAKRILSTMREDEIIHENPDAVMLDDVKGKIEYQNVSFSFQKLMDRRLQQKNGDSIEGVNSASSIKQVRNTINNVTFEANPGDIVAILGPTGCGKSTLTKLLGRMYELDSGTIKIDGTNIKDISLESLRKNIGVIEQDIFLFSTTLKENIAYGVSQDVSDEKIIEIAKAAQAHEFIMSFNDGYETLVGERGVTLSGGQKQRIAIARAFLSDPKILILDDSSSAIDAQTEEKIQIAMDNLLKNRTVFIITHRLSTIKRANKIIVLRKGSIVAQGDHNTLLRTSKDYRRIFGRHIELPPLESQVVGEKVLGGK